MIDLREASEDVGLKVLLATGDPDTLGRVGGTLQQEGFTIVEASDQETALRRWQDDGPDVVVLDVTLPPAGAFDLCRAIRQKTPTPVIMLATAADEDAVVQGFLSGADDFVTRPSSFSQIPLRIRAVYSRYAASAERESGEIHIGDLILDRESHQLYRTDRPDRVVLLTPIEFRLFTVLAMNEGMVVSFTRLIEYAWAYRTYNRQDLDALKTHITHLRKKLRSLGGQPNDVAVVPRSGYYLPRVRKSSPNGG